MATALPRVASKATLHKYLDWCVAQGYLVGENPNYGNKKVTPGIHMANGLHYTGDAADINWANQSAERSKLIEAMKKAQSMGLAVTFAHTGTVGSAKNHQKHLHVDRGGWSNVGKGLTKVSPLPAPPKPATPAPSGGIKWLGHDRGVLVLGSQGPRVKALQIHLNKHYPAYSKLDPDSDYGHSVEKVVKEFQRRAGLKDDGEAGSATFKKLGLTF